MHYSPVRSKAPTFLGLITRLVESDGCQCASKPPLRSIQKLHHRPFATSSAIYYEPNPYADTPNERPRWQAPPPRMTAPYRSKPPVDNDFPVNEDPEKLDRVYERILGRDGHKVLTEEVKWLAVTHKSFDHGRRGYNERLSFLGRRIVELQTSLALVHLPSSKHTTSQVDEYGRTPFEHPALQSVDKLGVFAKLRYTDKKRVAQIAKNYGLDTVVRWKPKDAKQNNLSGQDSVLQQTLYAIIGAVALQKGAIVANDLVRERILASLGLR